MSKHCFLRRHPGEGTPMILAIVLVLLMLFCTVVEFSRVWIIAQGVKEAAQQAVISTINDNYDDVYHAVREGYAAGWYPDGTGRWDESVDTGDVYGQLASTLGEHRQRISEDLKRKRGIYHLWPERGAEQQRPQFRPKQGLYRRSGDPLGGTGTLSWKPFACG